MFSKNLGLQLSVGLLAISMTLACSRKAAQQTAVSAAHNPAQCPSSLAGQSFSADTTKSPMTIDVAEDKTKKLLILTFNKVEVVPVDGKKLKQANGTELVASCSGNSFKMAGNVLKGGDFLATLKPAKDGGLEFDEDRPERVSIHYSKTGVVTGAIQDVQVTIANEAAKITQGADKITGIPTKEDLAADQTKQDQTKTDATNTKNDLNNKADQLKNDANKKADELKNDANKKADQIKSDIDSKSSNEADNEATH